MQRFFAMQTLLNDTNWLGDMNSEKKRAPFLVPIGFCLAALFLLSVQLVPKAHTVDQEALLRVKVLRLIVDPLRDQPVVMLSDELEARALPIWIGFAEANAINLELEGIGHRRPLTHDLMERVIQKADISVHRTVITHLEEGTYYATLVLKRAGKLLEIDARPSDSIVMALKFKAPIFVSASLFEAQAVALSTAEGIEGRYGLSFQTLTPELAQAFSFGSTQGLLVSDVEEGSLAEQDGIKRGDIFVALGGQAVKDVVSIREALEKETPDLEARIFRDAQYLSVMLHLGRSREE
jgi:bifunctional DNase/RNase